MEKFCNKEIMKKYKLPSPNTKADAVILANGDFPTHNIPLSILKSANRLICCDGAIDRLSEHNIIPQAIVGDCDSMSDTNRIKYKSIIHHIEEQETNDLTKSIHFCLEHSFNSIIILGATGCREDHTIANISLLAEYINYTNNVCMITNYGIFNAITETSIFESYPKQQVSIFSIGLSEITSKNLKYPIENRIFSNWWQATLNESLNDCFEIETSDKTIVFRTF